MKISLVGAGYWGSKIKKQFPNRQIVIGSAEKKRAYHSIIYELIEDAKLALTGMLDPDLQENFIGYAEIKKVFSVC